MLCIEVNEENKCWSEVILYEFLVVDLFDNKHLACDILDINAYV